MHAYSYASPPNRSLFESCRARSSARVTSSALVALCILAGAPFPAAAQSPGAAVVRAIHDRWNGRTYATLTFRQETGFADGRKEIWWESIKSPGMLRIDVAASDADSIQRTILFRRDSLYQWRPGRPVAPGRALVHPLQLLFMDIQWVRPEQTTAKLTAAGFDLSRTHETTWNGRAMTVVGAAAGDSASRQFWVERERMLVVRVIEPGPQPNAPMRDTQVREHLRTAAGAWVEKDMRFYEGLGAQAREQQTELYTQVRTDVPLDDSIFMPGSPPPAWVAAEGLLAADRAFSEAGKDRDVVDAISAMFADDVMAPALRGKFAKGKVELTAVMRQNALNAGARATWTPSRAGVSADGTQGFTWGFMTVRRANAADERLKYLAYWVKGAAGWRVVAYRRTPSAPGGVNSDVQPPAIPAASVAVAVDAAANERHRASLVAAEQAFSDTAQKIGLGPAFLINGRADAINMGGPTDADFVRGNAAIAESVGADSKGSPSPVSWSAGEAAIVASSGDLGITFGIIRPNADASAPGFPFFTIWKRENGAWKYIAE